MSTHFLGLDAAGQTRWGSVASSLPRAASALRARASSAGMELRDATDVDLAAAVIAAEAWATTLNATSFQVPAQYGQEAVVVLSAILSRAAGHAGTSEEILPEICSMDPDLLEAAAGHARWASLILGDDAPEALRRAASDLSSAGPYSRFAAYGELLDLTAEAWSSL